MEKLFLACAIIGGIFLVIRLILQFLGSDFGGHGDVDLSGGDISGHLDTVLSFKMFSFQALSAFLLMFGLVGMALLKEAKLAIHWAVLGALVAGFLSVVLMNWLISMMMKLQSSGTIKMENAVGQEGRVYLRIPAGEGTGKVQIEIQGRLEIYDAVSETKEELVTGTAVRVTRVVAGQVLVVERA